jgi:glycosyltransferase involved in cell wall biosynthesis
VGAGRTWEAVVRIALVTEGTYPVHSGGVSTWCQQLLEGMPEHEWTVVALTATSADQPTWPQPASVREVVLHPLWERLPPPPRRRRSGADPMASVEQALRLLWDAALAPDGDSAVHQARIALHRLVTLSANHPLAGLLNARASVATLLTAWDRRMPDAPRMTVAEAVAAATLVDRMLGAVDARCPEVDLVHAAGNGAAALVGLAGLWRSGTPFVLSEHGVYLRERYLALDDGDRTWAERRAITGVIRRICEVAYRECDRVLPVSDFNRRWALRLGAGADRVRTIRNGVEPEKYAPIEGEPEVPTLSFVGRIDPLKDLHTLVRAFALVQQRLPTARLRMFGPVPEGNEAYRDSVAKLIAELGVAGAATFEGPTPGSRPAIAAGHVVVLSSVSEGLPFSVIEAMMCGRATVSTDVGGVAECYDADRRAGIVVPSRDPEAMAEACVGLLEDDDRRREVARAARWHALGTATLERAIDEYRAVYATFAPVDDTPAVEPDQIAPQAPVLVTGRHRAVVPAPRNGQLVGSR